MTTGKAISWGKKIAFEKKNYAPQFEYIVSTVAKHCF